MSTPAMADSNGRPLSIIDGYIQQLRIKLKDPSLDKSYLRASIQTLEALWDVISSDHGRKSVPKTTLGKPIFDRDLPFCKDLKWDLKHKEQIGNDSCEVLDYSSKDGDARDVSFNLLLAVEEKRSRYIFKSLQEIDTVSRIRPFDKISYIVKKRGENEGKKMAGFLYPHFKMLKEYGDNVHSADFPKIIKGLIVGLVNLEKEFETEKEIVDMYNIENKLCVVQEGRVGSIIFLTSPAEPELYQEGPSAQTDLNQERPWQKDYKSLAQDLRDIFGVPKVLKKHELSKVPYGFRVVLDCMELAWNKRRRLRLLNAPFFLSDEKKIMEFIPMMHAAMRSCDRLERLMVQEIDVQHWQSKVKRECGARAVEVLEGGNYKNDGPAFLRFLFNCKKHLKCDNDLKKWEQIMKIINKVYKKFLDYIFYLSYLCKWNTIPMLDLN